MPTNIPPGRIFALRTKAGLTQADAAKRAGMGQSRWSEHECGIRVKPSLDTVMRIARALDVPLDRLLK